MLETLEGADEAMVHWRIACAAGEVHSALIALRLLDDEFGHRPTNDERAAALSKAESFRGIAGDIQDLLALPAEMLTVFNLDRGVVNSHLATRQAAAVLWDGTETVASKYETVANGTLGELRLVERDGVVLELTTGLR